MGNVAERLYSDNESEDMDLQVARYKPEGIDSLVEQTHFSRKELQIMYRGFKQECPTGIVNEETFKEIYAQFFPQGVHRDADYNKRHASTYAHYVFNTFDQDHNGSITFEEFVIGLSVLARGSVQDKLEWAFNLYDTNRDGIISRCEMHEVVSSIYDLMGRCSDPVIDENTVKDHVDRVFVRMDLDRDGCISLTEFMDSCQQDDNIVKAMSVFDTVL